MEGADEEDVVPRRVGRARTDRAGSYIPGGAAIEDTVDMSSIVFSSDSIAGAK